MKQKLLLQALSETFLGLYDIEGFLRSCKYHELLVLSLRKYLRAFEGNYSDFWEDVCRSDPEDLPRLALGGEGVYPIVSALAKLKLEDPESFKRYGVVQGALGWYDESRGMPSITFTFPRAVDCVVIEGVISC
jgi:hypothetical protein